MLNGVKDEERRRFAGRVVRDEIARQRKTQDEVAQAARMSPSTMARILRGDVLQDSPKLRAVEGVLLMPDDLLRLIIENDRKRLRSLHDDDIRPSLRRAILYELGRIETATAVEDDDDRKAQ